MANIERKFGAKVRSLRLERGWTQGDLASKMTAAGHPMHQTTVAKLENGTRPTSVAEASSLASIYGISTGSLFGDTTPHDVSSNGSALFEKWAFMESEAVRARERADKALNQFSQFVLDNSDTLKESPDQAAAWAEAIASSKTTDRASQVGAIWFLVPTKQAHKILKEKQLFGDDSPTYTLSKPLTELVGGPLPPPLADLIGDSDGKHH